MARTLAPVICLLLPVIAQAGPIIDQSYSPVSAANEAIINVQGSPVQWAQTFTVGITGMLVELDLKVYNVGATAPLLVDIRTVAAGSPTEPDIGANILSSASIDAASIGNSFLGSGAFFHLTLPTPVSVTAGQVLAIALRSTQAASPGSGVPSYRWQGNSGENYTSGASYVRTGGTWSLNDSDRSFRTYVEPAEVPEPGSFGLLACGAIGLLTAARRRNRSRSG